MDYWGILKRSFEITWRHKSMWLYGFLLALFSGGGGNFNSNINSSQQKNFTKSGLSHLPHISNDVLIILIIAAVVLFLFLLALSVFLGNLSQAALIGMVEDVESEGKTSIGSGWRHGLASWWRIFVIGLLVGFPVFVVVLLLGGLVILPGVLALVVKKEVLGFALIFIGVIIFLVILLLLVIPASLVVTLAYRCRVLEQKKSVESIKEGWRLFRSNLGRVLLMWLILFAVGLVIGTVISVVSLFVLIPVILAAFVDALLVVLLAIPVVFVLAFLQGIVQVFTQSVWTLFYKEITKPAEAPA